MKYVIMGVLAVFMVIGLSGCSTPIDRYEDRLNSTEKMVNSKTYEKRYSQEVQKISDEYKKAGLSDFLESGKVFKSYDNLFQENHKGLVDASKELRSFEDKPNNPFYKVAASRAYGQMTVSETVLFQINRDVTSDFRLMKEFLTQTSKYEKSLEKLLSKFKKAKLETLPKIEKAKKDHPHQTERLEKMFSRLNVIEGDLISALDVVAGIKNGQTKSFEAINDFRAQYQLINPKSEAPIKVAKDIEMMVLSLYDSYSKTLVNASENHSVKMALVSWDSYWDFPTETKVYFDYVTVGSKDLDRALQKFNGQTLSKRRLLNDSHFKRVSRYDDSRKKIPSGDNEVSVWVEDYESEYLHEYIVINNGQKSRDWEEVNQFVYSQYSGQEGMEVGSKPYGFFADEISEKPAKVGSRLVGNPHYGEWKTDEKGVETWSWLDTAAGVAIGYMLSDSGGASYTRDDYRNNPYYSKDKGSNRRDSNVQSAVYTPSSVYSRSGSGTYAYKNSGYSNSAGNTSSASGYKGSGLRSVSSSARGRGPSGGGK